MRKNDAKNEGKGKRDGKSRTKNESSKITKDSLPKTDSKPFNKGRRNPTPFKKAAPNRPRTEAEGIRLNRYLANAGVATRRDADTLIIAGTVTINGKVVTELGTKVMIGDEVSYEGTKIKKDTKRYVLLNKPKDFVCAEFDPKGRKTVIDLISKACKERVAPVGKLSRASTGILLLTNDSDLSRKLNNPRNGMKNIYHVGLDKKLHGDDMKKLVEGVELEDGISQCEEVVYVGNDKKEVGIEIVSSKNGIIQRMFDKLGYEVSKLDRVYFAGLTKKDLPRGTWRHLTQEELNILMRLPNSKSKTTS